jgi:GAF domain-containing protein
LSDPARLAAVHRQRVLDTPRDDSFDRVARMCALVFDAPIATVSIVDVDRVWFAASVGLDGVAQVGADPGLCTSAVLEGAPYIVFNARLDPRTLEHPLVRGALGLQFYAAAPIISSDGHPLGTVTAIDRAPRRPEAVTPAQISLLSELAGCISDQLELRLAALHTLQEERRQHHP